MEKGSDTPVVQVLVNDAFLQKEVEKMVNQRLDDLGIGTWWNMRRLMYETGKSRGWIQENILSDPNIRSFSRKIGGQWVFKPGAMKQYLMNWFEEAEEV
ncbi:DUF771 domain-containing protein [Sporolactobacillus pectinivorans]|uniref:DUF771 domain-containing protein n=1 Tax=Sporolactobacillus pectinivorans TaxID=1591408 RepID=UPI000C261C9A|nr:DUF771 domain-containing protein [Sporolactobacillus pectinivorans]